MFAVIQTAGPWYHNLKFNWFDFALVAVAVLGFVRGRKRGMTKELLPTLQWLSILLCGAFGHVYVADWYAQHGVIRTVFGSYFNERTAALMSGYLTIAVLLYIVFTSLQRKYMPKLEGSNFFGSNEYYWGVPAGIVRYLSMVLVALALLNARHYSSAEVAAIKTYKLNTFAAGGGVKGLENDTGDFFPSVYQVQDSIFKESLLGPVIKQYLSMLLINTVENSRKTTHS